MAASGIYFFKLFLSSCKQSLGLLWMFQNVLPRSFDDDDNDDDNDESFLWYV